ncbi:MAG: OmpA family protein [Zoogloea sp.]|nr:OmpA family protein [Zoogloea sp.]
MMAAGLFALGLVLLLSGFSSVPPTDAAKSAMGAGAWQELAEDLVKRASTFQVMAELGDSEPSAKLAIETQVAFENNKDHLKPDYARFLADITLILQIKPDVHVTITGFGNNPATNYNPVLLGKRVRAVQVFFAENGIPMEQIEAGVKEADEYEGPNTLLGKASSGQLITVHFAQT